MSNSSDYLISNQGGQTFRTELNQVLGDIKSLNSGSTEPSNKSAWMLWADTSNNLLKVRNGSNNDWITLGTLGTNMGLASLSEATQQNFTGPIQATEFISNSTGRLKMPVGNDTTERPSSAVQGDTRFNSTLKLLETYSGSAWLSMFSGAKLDIFSSTGTSTFTPADGRTNFLVVCTGGGGGGAAVKVHGTPSNYWGASGGGGAGTAIKFYSLAEIGSSASVTVGSGGAVSNSNDNGNLGQDSVFDPSATSGQKIRGRAGIGSSLGYGTATAAAMSRPGWPGGPNGTYTGGDTNEDGDIYCSGEKAEFQTINNYTGATASGIAVTDMRSSGGSTFWGKGPGAGANGIWSNSDATGSAGQNGIVVVLSW